MIIGRYYKNLDKYLKPNHVLIIFGPRQVGKTTLLENFLSQTKMKYKLDFGDSIRIRNLLESQGKLVSLAVNG